MSPHVLHRAVAHRTGETIGLIARRGFSLALLSPPRPERDLRLCVACPGCDRRLPVTADEFEAADPDAEFWTDCGHCDAGFPFYPDEVRVA